MVRSASPFARIVALEIPDNTPLDNDAVPSVNVPSIVKLLISSISLLVSTTKALLAVAVPSVMPFIFSKLVSLIVVFHNEIMKQLQLH